MKYRVLSCIQRFINGSYVWCIIQMVFDLYLFDCYLWNYLILLTIFAIHTRYVLTKYSIIYDKKNCPSIFFAKTSHIQQTNWTILIPHARNDRKSLLILIRTTTYCFSEKTFFIYRCLRELSKICWKYKPLSNVLQQTKTKYPQYTGW